MQTKILAVKGSEQDYVGECLRAGSGRKEQERDGQYSAEALWGNGALPTQGQRPAA